MSTNQITIVKDIKEKSIFISREFKAPIELVWKAFTESIILDQWWGPAPWRAETKFQDFREGGYWLYAMVSPENEKHWGRMNYISIDLHKKFDLEDVFCDEDGNLNLNLPISKGTNTFTATQTGTMVNFNMYYSTEKQLQEIIEMGFELGITQCFEQLNDLISAQKI